MQNDNELQREADEAVRVLKEGGIILYPTDTVWGLGCDATNAEAVERIYKLKRSENKKSMLVLCASADMVVRYVNRAPGIAFEVMELATSPLTAILPGAVGVAGNLIPEEGTQKRFSDVDPFQHVNNVSQQMYFDVGKMEYYEQVLGDEVLLGDLRIITVSTSTSYMGQIRLHDRVRVTTTCEKIGNKSLTLFQQLVVDGQVRSESRSVMVAFDFARQLSMPVPEAWRTRLLAD